MKDSAHDDLLRRADRYLGDDKKQRDKIGYGDAEPWSVPRLVRDLRDALVAASTLPDAVRAVLEDNISEYRNAEIEAFLAAHKPLESAEPITRGITSLADRGSNESATVDLYDEEAVDAYFRDLAKKAKSNESALRAKIEALLNDGMEQRWDNGDAWGDGHRAACEAVLALLSERDEAALADAESEEGRNG